MAASARTAASPAATAYLPKFSPIEGRTGLFSDVSFAGFDISTPPSNLFINCFNIKAPPVARMAQKNTPAPRRRAGPRHTVRAGRSAAEALKKEIKQYYDANGFLSWSAARKKYVILGTSEPTNGLVRCPECGTGQLVVVRSRTTRKRFLGCSNYYNGCAASAPLLQRAKLRVLKRACPGCGWPIVMFRYSRKQSWTKQCANRECDTRG
ncbi:DNA topoisomerase I [Cenarchaeum symbiosum A]|uniref:DNA topoisomerase I n=1 Tax=Cenarchaeum symbiosum (strain A) TaxID=414004 RepID=A0RYH5_CENSY|nr:DNA topoisomerase I [Cenarchaeum symbiosum A]